ncbi:hypothetical protein GCM10020219_028530 [Nonomuraea dietziae]
MALRPAAALAGSARGASVNNTRTARVGQDVLDLLCGEPGVDGHPEERALVQGHLRDDHLIAVACERRHGLPRSDPASQQGGGQPVRDRLQLPVGPSALPADQRLTVGPEHAAPAEIAAQIHVAIPNPGLCD